MPKNQSTQATAEKEALAILRENKPRTPVEQAAVDALDQRRWVLWHADDYSLGVILLLSHAGLLRDKAHEEQEDSAARSNARWVAEARTADAIQISTLDQAIDQACTRLAGSEDPADVAAWLKEIRSAAHAIRDQRGGA